MKQSWDPITILIAKPIGSPDTSLLREFPSASEPEERNQHMTIFLDHPPTSLPAHYPRQHQWPQPPFPGTLPTLMTRLEKPTKIGSDFGRTGNCKMPPPGIVLAEVLVGSAEKYWSGKRSETYCFWKVTTILGEILVGGILVGNIGWKYWLGKYWLEILVGKMERNILLLKSNNYSCTERRMGKTFMKSLLNNKSGQIQYIIKQFMRKGNN